LIIITRLLFVNKNKTYSKAFTVTEFHKIFLGCHFPDDETRDGRWIIGFLAVQPSGAATSLRKFIEK